MHNLEASTHLLSTNSRWGHSLAWINIISSFVYKKYIISSWLLRTFVTTPIILISINFRIQNKLIFTLLRRAWPYVKLIYSLPQLFCVIIIVHKVSILHQVPCHLLFYKSCTEPSPSEPSSSLDTSTRSPLLNFNFLDWWWEVQIMYWWKLKGFCRESTVYKNW